MISRVTVGELVAALVYLFIAAYILYDNAEKNGLLKPDVETLGLKCQN